MLLAIIAEANKHKAAIGDRMHANVTKAREAKISLQVLSPLEHDISTHLLEFEAIVHNFHKPTLYSSSLVPFLLLNI